MLWQGALDKAWNVGIAVTDGSQSVGHAKSFHEVENTVGEDLAGLVAVPGVGVTDVSAQARAASRWRVGWEPAVKRTTAAVLRMTEMPCGTSGWSTLYPGGVKLLHMPATG